MYVTVVVMGAGVLHHAPSRTTYMWYQILPPTWTTQKRRHCLTQWSRVSPVAREETNGRA
jgi:hypothetical protein